MDTTIISPPRPLNGTPGRGLILHMTAGAFVLLLLCAALVACGPTEAGCRGANAALLATESPWLAPNHAGTLMGPFPAQPRPARDERRFNCTKQESPVWQKLKPHRGSIKTNGKKGKKARFYEWDNTHNDIEVYGPARRYEHLGSMDPRNGNLYKPAVKGRNLRDELK